MMRIKKLLTPFSRRFFFVVEVQGESAWPVLVPGKRYLATGLLKPKAGEFVVFRNPKDISRVLVKRVKKIVASRPLVESLVSWGSSSSEYGLIPRDLVLGKLIKVGANKTRSLFICTNFCLP